MIWNTDKEHINNEIAKKIETLEITLKQKIEQDIKNKTMDLQIELNKLKDLMLTKTPTGRETLSPYAKLRLKK